MRNDYRSDQKVLHCVVEAGLHGRVKALAAADGVSITEFVTRVLESVTDDAVGVGSGHRVVPRTAGSVHGTYGAGGGGGVTVGGAVGRGVDWGVLLSKPASPVVVERVLDPIEDIA
jgi:hypothetical protein